MAALAVATLAVSPALAPADAWARAGSGSSMGSRGSFTSAPPAVTRTAPYAAQPMQRSMTPQSAPSYANPGMGQQPAFANRSPFMSGLMGGLIGAGIGGLLFGHGMFGGLGGGMSFIGLLLQIFIVVMIVRFVIRLVRGRSGGPAFAFPGMARNGAPNPMDPTGGPVGGGFGMGGGLGGGAPRQTTPVAVGPADFQAYESILKGVQLAWSNHDLAALRGLATPEMLSYFAEQVADQSSRGVRNVVSDVRLEQGDLSEAWGENGREYATVAMRFSMMDVTRDGAGRVVDGSDTVRSMATEIWTFLRAPGGRWMLSAIQQTG